VEQRPEVLKGEPGDVVAGVDGVVFERVGER